MKAFTTAVVAVLAAAAALAAPAAARSATPDHELLRTYQPVTVFDPSERFRPTSVQSFVADAQLEQLSGGTWTVVDPDPEPGELPAPGSGVWRLNQRSCSTAAPLGGLACYAGAWDEGSGGTTVYGRVARLSDAIVLQYWLFYYDDVYSYVYPPADVLWQAHEGDWEVVNVVLSSDATPVRAGYSQHCLGETRAWSDVSRRDGTHPVVYVAAGSHANYFTPGAHQFDVRCIPPAVLGLLLQHGLPLPVDVAGIGEAAATPGSGLEPTTIKAANESSSWVRFDGFWGEGQFFHSPFTGTVPFGTSPVGPALHAVWSDPLGTLAAWTAS